MVEGNLEATKISQMGLSHVRDQLLLGPALGPGPNHDRRTVGVIGTEVDCLMAAQPLKTGEDVCLDIFDEMPEVDVAVGVGQGRGDQDPAGIGHGPAWSDDGTGHCRVGDCRTRAGVGERCEGGAADGAAERPFGTKMLLFSPGLSGTIP